jgi:hypothetical protein
VVKVVEVVKVVKVVKAVKVNPAYTSVIGAVNYARSKGISTHPGAAYAIARRG